MCVWGGVHSRCKRFPQMKKKNNKTLLFFGGEGGGEGRGGGGVLCTRVYRGSAVGGKGCVCGCV